MRRAVKTLHAAFAPLSSGVVLMAFASACGGKLFQEPQEGPLPLDASMNDSGLDAGAFEPDLGVPVAELSASGWRVCARRIDGRVYCWGSTYQQGAVAAPPSLVRDVRGAISVSTGRDLGCVVLEKGELRCFTDGFSDDKPRVYFPRGDFRLSSGSASQVSCGEAHCCAVTDAGGVHCWGDNEYGQLGDGNREPSDLPVGVDLGSAFALSVSAGFFHTCARLRDGQVRCWGSNSEGRIGLPQKVELERSPIPVAFSRPTRTLVARTDLTCALGILAFSNATGTIAPG